MNVRQLRRMVDPSEENFRSEQLNDQVPEKDDVRRKLLFDGHYY